MQVIKRDGRKEEFDALKIENAINKCLKQCNYLDEKLSKLIVSSINRKIKDLNEIEIEKIQDLVEDELIHRDLKELAKSYIKYRHDRSNTRQFKSSLTQIFHEINTTSSNDMDLKRENANIDANTSMGTMLKYGSEAAKDYNLKYLIKPEYAQAHINGDLHIHDLDFYSITMNCVNGNTRIILKAPDNNIFYTDANFFKGLGEGIHELKDWKIFSNGNFVNLEGVSIRKETSHYNRITSKYSMINVTDNHIVPIKRNNINMEVKAIDIELGDELLADKFTINEDERIKQINIIDVVQDRDDVYIKNSKVLYDLLNDNNMIKDFYLALRSNNLLSKNRYFNNDLMPLNCYTKFRDKFIELGVKEETLELTYKRSSNIIKPILSLNSDFGYFVGMFYAEGSTYKHGITLSNKNNQIFEKILNISKKIFNGCNIEQYENKNGVKIINIYSALISLLFSDLLFKKKKSINMRIPGWFNFANIDFLQGFIAGYIDGDGCVNNHGTIVMTSACRDFLQDLNILCQNLDVVTRFSKFVKKGRMDNVNDVKFISKADCGNLITTINRVKHLDLTASLKINKINSSYTFEESKRCIKNTVKEIEKVPYEGFVYDFQTENHYFTADGVILHNCLFIPLGKLLKEGFNTGHGSIRPPQSIQSASSLACIILQSNQNEMFGGQAFPTFDYDLAPYVAKSFIKNLSNCLKFDGFDSKYHCDLKSLNEKLEDFYNVHNTIIENKDDICKIIQNSTEFFDEIEDGIECRNDFIKCYDYAYEKTNKDTYQAMESLIHNANTLHSRAGAQVPFSSINYGTCTLPEGRMIIENVLSATEAGLGHGETPIFPVQIFKMKKGINWYPEDPNYDLMKHAIKCSAKRLFPNFAFLDAPYNLQYYKENKPETEVAVMGMTAFGNVKLRCKNSFFDSDICHVRKWLIDNHLVQKEMKKFDKNTYYYDLTGVEIYDGVNGFVNCKKYMICDDACAQWYSIEILSNTNNIIHLKLTDDHPVVGYSFANESGEDDICVNGKMFKRLQVKQLKYGDYILLENKNIGVIQNIHKVDPLIGYDFETETDIFALNGIISHNCRTRVLSNHFDPEHEQVTGRGNFAFCTINLPRLGIEANHDINKFFELFDHRIDQAIGSLKDRFELIGHKHVYNYPFLMGQNVYLTSENLNYNDEIKEVIKQASISVGFIGLAECLVALIGKHHGESDEAQELGLKIVKHLRQRMDDETEKTGLNWSAFATPAEGLCISGDTLVQTSNGNIPIKDVKVGDLVMTFNETSCKCELKKVINSGMTFEKAKVMKITFDNNDHLICTPNHPIMIRKGVMRNEKQQFTSNGITNEILEYVEAKDLKIGMRVKSNSIYIENGYKKVRNGKSMHRMVYEYYNGAVPPKYCVHHLDENKLNNDISNLKLMSNKEHQVYHLKDNINKYCFISENVTGDKNPFYGKKHTIETKNKISFTKRLQNNKNKISDNSLISLFYSGHKIDEIAQLFNAKSDIIEYRLHDELGISRENNHIIVNIEYLQEEMPVYDLTIEDNHNFFVCGDHGVLIHNSGRFIKIDRKKYGVIPGVTDRDFYTNSSHIPVYYKTNFAHKIDVEAPYHELCNAGHIGYVEMDGNPNKNLQAYESIVKYAGEKGMTYFSINTQNDRCPVCGYLGIIDDVCPRCGFKEGEGVSVEHLKACGCWNAIKKLNGIEEK